MPPQTDCTSNAVMSRSANELGAVPRKGCDQRSSGSGAWSQGKEGHMPKPPKETPSSVNISQTTSAQHIPPRKAQRSFSVSFASRAIF